MLYAPTWVGHFARAELPDPATHKRVAVMVNAAFPEARYDVEDLSAEGGRVGSRVVIRATHQVTFRGLAPTGRAVTWTNMNIQRDYERMKAAGAEFTMPPTKVTGLTIAMVNDTCGNLIQIAQLDRYSG